MIVVAGHLTVAPGSREAYLAGCRTLVQQARSTSGCLDFALSADLVAADRINILERWASQQAVDEFRGRGVPEEQASLIVAASVAEYDVAAERMLG